MTMQVYKYPTPACGTEEKGGNPEINPDSGTFTGLRARE